MSEESKSFPEDYAGGEGKYECICCNCKGSFYGHKRRIVCKVCRTSPTPAERVEQEPLAWVAESSEPGQLIDGRPRRIWWECKKGIGIPFYTAPQPSPAPAAIELSGIGRDAGHPRAVVLYLRHEPLDEDLRTIQEMFRTGHQGAKP